MVMFLPSSTWVDSIEKIQSVVNKNEMHWSCKIPTPLESSSLQERVIRCFGVASGFFGSGATLVLKCKLSCRKMKASFTVIDPCGLRYLSLLKNLSFLWFTLQIFIRDLNQLTKLLKLIKYEVEYEQFWTCRVEKQQNAKSDRIIWGKIVQSCRKKRWVKPTRRCLCP